MNSLKWDFERPYLIAHDQDGYCMHLDRQTYKCTVRDHRPVPCRGFDCRESDKWDVWLDFENKVINEELFRSLEESNGKPVSTGIESGLKDE